MAYTAPTRSTHNAGAALLYHVQKNGKRREGVISRGVNCTAEHAREEFAAMRRICGYRKGVEAYTDIISFPEGEVTREQALDAACEAYSRAFPNTQYVATVHDDGRGGKTHVHFCKNNVDLSTGKRLKTANMLNLLKSKVDEVCKERGLSVIELKPSRNKYRSYSPEIKKRYKAAETYSKKLSWKQYIVFAVDNAAKCASEEEFIKEMARSGVTVTKRAGGYTYQTGSHKVRGKKLGSNYDKDYLLSKFSKNAKPIEKPTYKPTEAEKVGMEILRGMARGLSNREILGEFSARLAEGGEAAHSRLMEASNQITRGKLCLPVSQEFLSADKKSLDASKIRANPKKFEQSMAKHAAKKDGEMLGNMVASLVPIPGLKSIVRKATADVAEGVLKASYAQGAGRGASQGQGQKTLEDIITGQKDSHAQLVATAAKSSEPDDWFWLNDLAKDDKREEAARKRMY